MVSASCLCKGGVQAKNTLTSDVKSWFEWARGQRIVLAMSGEVVYTTDGEAVALVEMMAKYPCRSWFTWYGYRSPISATKSKNDLYRLLINKPVGLLHHPS